MKTHQAKQSLFLIFLHFVGVISHGLLQVQVTTYHGIADGSSVSVNVTGTDSYIFPLPSEQGLTRTAGQNALIEFVTLLTGKAFILSEQEIAAQLGAQNVDLQKFKTKNTCRYLFPDGSTDVVKADYESGVYLLPLPSMEAAPHNKYPVVKFQSSYWYYVVRRPGHHLSWIEGDILMYKDPYPMGEAIRQKTYVPWGPFRVAKVAEM